MSKTIKDHSHRWSLCHKTKKRRGQKKNHVCKHKNHFLGLFCVNIYVFDCKGVEEWVERLIVLCLLASLIIKIHLQCFTVYLLIYKLSLLTASHILIIVISVKSVNTPKKSKHHFFNGRKVFITCLWYQMVCQQFYLKWFDAQNVFSF